ncbi:MAG: transposase [Acidobacteria bacterium]|nr:transposase [Acidobacteriota bacterium]
MARPLRILFAGAVYHVMARGNAKGLIFLDDLDHRRFLTVLEDTLRRFGIVCHAFCLMPNHYHLAVVTPAANLSAAIKHLNGVYSQWWNRRHGRCGHVFQGRFKAQVIQKDPYLLVACRYIVLNPVRAGLVKHPQDWRWSSYQATAGLELAPAPLDVQVLHDLLSCGPGVTPGMAYREFVCGTRSAQYGAVGRLIRRGSRCIGDVSFLEDERAELAKTVSRAIPRQETLCPPPSLAELLDLARSTKDRNDRICSAHLRFGYRLTEIARHLGLHRVTVGQILRPLRRRRDAGVGEEVDVGDQKV